MQINKTVEIKHIRVEVEICRLMELHLFVSHVIWHVKTPNGQQSELNSGFAPKLPYKLAPPAAPAANRG